jgi:hypothetical protein
MDDFRIPVQHHQALARYFEHSLECSFALSGESCTASDVFHFNGFLPLIVEVASLRSVLAFNEPISATITQYEHGMLGKTVALSNAPDKIVLPLLVRAAELLFKPTRGKTIELYPIFEYFWTPADQREHAAWQPQDL